MCIGGSCFTTGVRRRIPVTSRFTTTQSQVWITASSSATRARIRLSPVQIAAAQSTTTISPTCNLGMITATTFTTMESTRGRTMLRGRTTKGSVFSITTTFTETWAGIRRACFSSESLGNANYYFNNVIGNLTGNTYCADGLIGAHTSPEVASNGTNQVFVNNTIDPGSTPCSVGTSSGDNRGANFGNTQASGDDLREQPASLERPRLTSTPTRARSAPQITTFTACSKELIPSMAPAARASRSRPGRAHADLIRTAKT